MRDVLRTISVCPNFIYELGILSWLYKIFIVFLYKIASSKKAYSGGGYKKRASEFLVMFAVIQSKRSCFIYIVLVGAQDLQQGCFSFAHLLTTIMSKSHVKVQKEMCGTSFFTMKHFLNSDKVPSCTKTLKAWYQTPDKLIFSFRLCSL